MTAHKLTHPFTHYGQFIVDHQHVFGQEEGTGVPVGNSGSTGRTCKLHEHSEEVEIEPFGTPPDNFKTNTITRLIAFGIIIGQISSPP